jgi:alpha-beta hydrolase superfamily lysophospholipase
MKHLESQWTSNNQVKFYVQEWLPDGEIVASITLVHGIGEHSGRYQSMAEYYCSKGISILSYDQRGHGKTEGKRGHIRSYDIAADDIDHFLQENLLRHPNIPHFIYGHSLGGAMALYYCLTNKPDINGAVISAPGLAPGTPFPPIIMFFAKILAKISPSFTMSNRLERKYLSRDPQVEQIYSNDPLVHDQVSASLGMDLITKGAWMVQNAASLEIPTLLMYGTDDHLVNLSSIREFIKHAKPSLLVKEWDGFYHEIHNEPEKQQVYDYVINWIKSKLT